MNRTVCAAGRQWLIGLGIGIVSAGPLLAQAQAPQLPARKPGLWEVTVRGAGNPGAREQKVWQCTDRQAEPIMLLAVVPGQEHCHEARVKKIAQGHEVRTTCYVHDNRVDATVQLSGDLRAAYRGTFEVQYSKAVRFNPGRTEFEGRWLGACKAGQQAGDMVLPNGATVNVVDDRKRADSQGHAGHQH
jgi:hypothetical protein